MADLQLGDGRGAPSRLLRWIVASLFMSFAAAFALMVASVWGDYQNIPNFGELRSAHQGRTIRLHATDGSVFFALGPSYGRWLPYSQIPKTMTQAIIATEDRRFLSHPGVDPIGIARAVWVALTSHNGHRRWQGASTISQQLARNLFLDDRYSWMRKIREASIALALEWKFSKPQILELYLNKVYFGGGAYGVDAASHRFFGHSARHLSIVEAALIAGLVKAPSNYSPTADAEASINRASVVLDILNETGAISKRARLSLHPEQLQFAAAPPRNSARYFTDWIMPQIDRLAIPKSGAFDVYTTLDPMMQRQATASLHANTPSDLQGALVAIDHDGAIRAMLGGLRYKESSYNRATTAARQPGSTWKLFVYLTAFENGYSPDSRVMDEPAAIDGWQPHNDDGRYHGEISLRSAFAYSVNTVAAELASQLGTTKVADMARRLGISTPISNLPSMALGTSDVHLFEMTHAYSVMARAGLDSPPFGIEKVTSAGRLLYAHHDISPHMVLQPWVAAEMTDLLQAVVANGTGKGARIDRPAAGKTGTTNNGKDGWFIGFSGGLTTGVWMGRDDSRPVPALYGGRAPAKAFADFMKGAIATRSKDFFRLSDVAPPPVETDPMNSGSVSNEATPALPDTFDGAGTVSDPRSDILLQSDGGVIAAMPQTTKELP